MNRRKFLLGAAATSALSVVVPSLVLPARTLAMAEPNRFYSIPAHVPERVSVWNFDLYGAERTLVFFTNYSEQPVKLSMMGRLNDGITYPWSMTVSGRGVCALGPFNGDVLAQVSGPDVDVEAQTYNPQHIEYMRSKPARTTDPDLTWADWRTTTAANVFKIPRSGV